MEAKGHRPPRQKVLLRAVVTAAIADCCGCCRFTIKAFRNRVDSRFCPVLWIMAWLWWSGLKTGPLFQHFEKGEYVGTLQVCTHPTQHCTLITTLAGVPTADIVQKHVCCLWFVQQDSPFWLLRSHRSRDPEVCLPMGCSVHGFCS